MSDAQARNSIHISDSDSMCFYGNLRLFIFYKCHLIVLKKL